MTVDYDAPRVNKDLDEPTPDELPVRRYDASTAALDVDDELADYVELPGADLSGEEFSVRVVPKRADEFTCTSCFLVYHRSRLARSGNGPMVCADCV